MDEKRSLERFFYWASDGLGRSSFGHRVDSGVHGVLQQVSGTGIRMFVCY
jgi:hypothetical protein